MVEVSLGHAGRWRQALARDRVLRAGLFLEAPLIFVAFYVWLIGIKGGWQMQDFAAVRSAALSVLHGHSPYPPPDPAVLIKARELVYPPLVAYLFVPFAILPYGVAAPLYFFLSIGALIGAIAVAGVRDWRCYGAIMLWYPTVACLGTGALGPLLALLLALVWRYRNRPGIAAPVLAVAIVAKLFLWPVLLWLAATRRWRAAFATAGTAGVFFLLPFAPLGWPVLRSYPHLLRSLDGVFGGVGFSASTFFRALGASTFAAHTAVVAVGVLLAALVLYVGLGRGDDGAAFALALATALLLSPIVWMHYYVLLVVPIAVAAPTLSPAWFVPMLCWGSPELESFGSMRRLVFGIGAVAATAVLSARARRPRPQSDSDAERLVPEAV
jgi:glycosyl transferase family 87